MAEVSRLTRPGRLIGRGVLDLKKPKTQNAFYKFLMPNLKCGHDNTEFYYPAPTPKYENNVLIGWEPGAWVTTNWDAEKKEVCGKGLHLFKKPCPKYLPAYCGNAYLAEGDGLLAEDEEKARFKQVRLVRPLAFNEIFHEKAQLSRASLRSAVLSSAILSSADLSYADLRSADLSYADLRSAVLRSAVLSSAVLSSAVLSSAVLRSADLSSADLENAYVTKGALTDKQLRTVKNADKIRWVDAE